MSSLNIKGSQSILNKKAQLQLSTKKLRNETKAISTNTNDYDGVIYERANSKFINTPIDNKSKTLL